MMCTDSITHKLIANEITTTLRSPKTEICSFLFLFTQQKIQNKSMVREGKEQFILKDIQ